MPYVYKPREEGHIEEAPPQPEQRITLANGASSLLVPGATNHLGPLPGFDLLACEPRFLRFLWDLVVAVHHRLSELAEW